MVILYHALLSTSDKNCPYLKELISVCVCVWGEGDGKESTGKQTMSPHCVVNTVVDVNTGVGGIEKGQADPKGMGGEC